MLLGSSERTAEDCIDPVLLPNITGTGFITKTGLPFFESLGPQILKFLQGEPQV